MASQGAGIRKTSRTLKVGLNTVMRYVKASEEELA
ncbi:IS1-like element transposase [Leminorella richardii]